jgi:hypothetical protein
VPTHGPSLGRTPNRIVDLKLLIPTVEHFEPLGGGQRVLADSYCALRDIVSLSAKIAVRPGSRTVYGGWAAVVGGC